MTLQQRTLIEITFGVAGFALFWYATNLIAALGLLIVLFANNVGHSRLIYKRNN